MNSLKKTLPAEGMRNTISNGADLGAKTGCLLSTLYTVFLWAVSGLGEYALGDIGSIACLVYPLTLAFVLLLGAITGAILAWLSRRLSGKVSRQRFVQIGMVICIIILAVVYVTFFTLSPLVAQQDSEHVNESVEYSDEYFADPPFLTLIQIVLVVLPNIIYVVAGGWVSRKLWLNT
jgi:uncharacterized membrane protein YdjX (TVP38/TMEM64 family)